MISLHQELHQARPTQQQEDLKLLHQVVLLAERLDQVRLTLQAISHQGRHLVQTTLHLHKVDLTTQPQTQLAVPLDINHQVHLNILALKDRTQVLELPSHLQTCHHHLTNLLKVSRHKPTLHTQHQEHRKRPQENIYRHDEDKLMQAFAYISLFMLQVIPIINRK